MNDYKLMNNYISDVERLSDKHQIAWLCDSWKIDNMIIIYLSIAALWSSNFEVSEELLWLTFVHQAGRNI